MAQLKSTLVQGALTVTGNAVASKLIKNGGTSDDILLGDGSTTSKSALMAMVNAAVVLKGTVGTNGTVTKDKFPAASESTLGYAYKVITKDTYQGVAAKVGDMLICYYTGSKYDWMLIPSGDDIEDTWREIKVNGTQILANGTTTNALNLKAGTNMTLTNSNGTVTFDATDTGATAVSITGDGNAFTNAEYNASTRTITFTKGSKYAAKDHNHDDIYLGKTTYEWNKEFSADSNGAVSLGRYNIYDTQLTFDITTTTSFTLSGKLVIASQNGKILKATIYGDASNTLAGYLTIYQSAITNNRSWVEVFCNFPGWSKNKVHIYGVALNNATVTNQMTSVTFTNGVPSGVTSGDAKWTGTMVNDITANCAATNHTHDVNIATSNGTNELTLAYGTKYALTAGGQSFVFTMPTDSNTTYGADRGISLKDGKFGHSNTAVTAVTTAGLYKIKYDAYGHITGTESFTLPTVNNGTLTIQKNGTKVATFTANQSGNATANITVPTKVSELTNDSNFLKAESDTLQTVTNRGATTNKAITTAGLTTTSTLYVTGTTGHREGIRIAPFEHLSSIWWNATGTQDYTTGQMWGITAYDKGYTIDATKANTFRFRGPTSSTATSATDQMWINTSGLVTSRGGFAKSGSSDSYVLLAGGGTKAISDITGTTYDADRGISLVSGKFGHSNTAVTAVTTKGLYKISYDAYGHITGTEAFTLPTVNNGTLTMGTSGTGVSGSATFTANQSSASTFTVTLDSSAAGNRGANKVVLAKAAGQIDSEKFTVTSAGATAVTMEYDSSYKALKFVFA